MRTADVRKLVCEVLDTLPTPYSHHVIDETFAAIEMSPLWRARYDALCSKLGRDVVNNWGGRWIAVALEKGGEQQVPSKRSTLIGSYSILDTDAKTRRPSKEDALQLMSDYYRSHKASLPTANGSHRALILELIMDGLTPEEAFSEALKNGA